MVVVLSRHIIRVLLPPQRVHLHGNYTYVTGWMVNVVCTVLWRLYMRKLAAVWLVAALSSTTPLHAVLFTSIFLTQCCGNYQSLGPGSTYCITRWTWKRRCFIKLFMVEIAL